MNVQENAVRTPNLAPASKNLSSALIIAVLPLWSDRGDAIHTREIATSLEDQGIATHIICLPGPDASPAEKSLSKVEVRPWMRRGLFQLSWNVFATVAALRTVRRESVDVIYSRLDPGMIVGWLVKALTGKPLIVEMNGLPTEDMRLFRPNAKFQIAVTRLWEKFMYKSADRIVGAPGYINYVKEVFHVASEKCRTVQLGVNTDLFRPNDKGTARHMLKLPSRPTVVWMGNMTLWQGLETLIKSMAHVVHHVPDVRLIVVGSGVLFDECNALSRSLDLSEHVVFVGHVPYARVPVYLQAADVCVSSFPGSRGIKGSISALKTVSYLAVGRPVVTTWMDELADAITAQGAGYGVPPDDPAAMADRIVMLLSEPEEVAKRRNSAALSLVSAGRSWVETAGVIAQSMEEVTK